MKKRLLSCIIILTKEQKKEHIWGGLKNEQRRKNNFREHGIYLLGWRNGDEPDPSKKVENMTDEEIEKFLD